MVAGNVVEYGTYTVHAITLEERQSRFGGFRGVWEKLLDVWTKDMGRKLAAGYKAQFIGRAVLRGLRPFDAERWAKFDKAHPTGVLSFDEQVKLDIESAYPYAAGRLPVAIKKDADGRISLATLPYEGRMAANPLGYKGPNLGVITNGREEVGMTVGYLLGGGKDGAVQSLAIPRAVGFEPSADRNLTEDRASTRFAPVLLV